MSNPLYYNNPLVHRDRRINDGHSAWVKQFSCEHIKPLIICGGPIRKEAIDVFREMGIDYIGILLSEKDSIVYRNALAPELRLITEPQHVHRIPDYTGENKEARDKRIQQIIDIAKTNGYNSIFAGYGFMAEDENLVLAIEAAGLNFIGPCSTTVRRAGFKDEAKRTALEAGVSVTPGQDNATTLTLLAKHPTKKDLKELVAQEGLELEAASAKNESADESLEEFAQRVLSASYRKGIDLYTIAELQETIRQQVMALNSQYPKNRIRLKCIGGGGGKGQRILPNPKDQEGSDQEKLEAVANKAPDLVMEILQEVKATGEGDNKNILIELNIETTRHQEIQVLGNGNWTLALGGRDCSLQMHEQKLLEVSVTEEDLQKSLNEVKEAGKESEVKVLEQDIITLRKMEEEAERFSKAVGLDSLSTFECIVDGDTHFFMEMNTRIQVEHRVTELCYSLKFSDPGDSNDYFIADSLVEAMVLLAAHGPKLPKPTRVPRYTASLEARLNATNQALAPHAGGYIEFWSEVLPNEIRDDQGICLHNPDTLTFMPYQLAGAYDSNIALLLTTGESRYESYQRLAEIIRITYIEGKDLETNLEFHYGLLNWFLGNNINARPTTRFIVPYLTAVGELKHHADNFDVDLAYAEITKKYLDAAVSEEQAKSIKSVFELKALLLKRPIKRLFEAPHALAGWLSLHQKSWHFSADGNLVWADNPIRVLSDLYLYLNYDYHEGRPAAEMIWGQDNKHLQDAIAFYDEIETRLGETDFNTLCDILNQESHADFEQDLWNQVRAAHMGYQVGKEMLKILPHLAQSTKYFDLKVNDDLSIDIPESLLDTELQSTMLKALAPPPKAKGNEVAAPMGGMFYARSAPDAAPFIEVGTHFEAGDPICIIEVMKMFNTIKAPFSGTVEQVLIDEDGTIIRKGDSLFKVKPDDMETEDSEEQQQALVRQQTKDFVEAVCL